MSTFIYQSVEYVVIDCGHRGNGCGMSFAVTREFYDHIKGTGAGWHCPNGHSRKFTGPTDTDRLRQAEARETALQDQLTAAIHEGESVRAQLVRDRARFSNGVCLCCNRSFENVRRHMSTKHPDYDVTKVAEAARIYKCSCGRSFSTDRGLRVHQGHSRVKDDSTFRWDKPNQDRYYAHLTVVTK